MSIKRFVCALLLSLPLSAQAALTIQNWQTPQGARVYFVESHELPMLDISVDFPGGSARDPAGKAGLAQLTHGLLDQGAGGLSDTAIAHRLADVGAVLGGAFDRDRAGVTLRTLSSSAEKTAALELLARVLQQPEFPQAVVKREKQRLISAIREAEADPGTVAEKAFYRALYGTHPYAHDESGDPAAIAKLTRADLQAFYRAHYSAPNAVIALMGDISRAEAEAIATRLAAGLSKAARVAELPQPASAPVSDTRIAHPSTQSHVLVGAVGMARDDPDFFPLFVGNYVLGGGGFDSRLMKEVRDKRGYAYSAYSYFTPDAGGRAVPAGLADQARADRRRAQGGPGHPAAVHRRGAQRGRTRPGQIQPDRRFSAAHRQQQENPRLPVGDRLLQLAAGLSGYLGRARSMRWMWRR